MNIDIFYPRYTKPILAFRIGRIKARPGSNIYRKNLICFVIAFPGFDLHRDAGNFYLDLFKHRVFGREYV